MDWKEYEQITKLIYETLGKETGVKIIGHGNTCKVKGKSGVYHQIDVLTSHSDGNRSYQTAIECKYWKDQVNKETVMKVASIIEDAEIAKGVVVSKKGFTSDGISYAKYKNIGLVELGELVESDLKDGEKVPTIDVMSLFVKTNVEIRRPEILGIKLDIVKGNPLSKNLNPYSFIVKQNDGTEVQLENYLKVFRDFVHQKEPDKVVQKYYEVKDAHLVNKISKEVIQIRGFTLLGKLTIKNENSTRHLDIVDEVWLKMKSLFENESFSISKYLMIKKDNSLS